MWRSVAARMSTLVALPRVEQLSTSADGATVSPRVLTPPSYDGDVNLQLVPRGSLRSTPPSPTNLCRRRRARPSQGVWRRARARPVGLLRAHRLCSVRTHQTALFQAGRTPAHVDRSGRPASGREGRHRRGQAGTACVWVSIQAAGALTKAVTVVEEPKMPTSPHFDGRQIGSPRSAGSFSLANMPPPPPMRRSAPPAALVGGEAQAGRRRAR